MNERKLTPEEINGLFLFCRKHKVTYYDVQIELVDHLASAIEGMWETNSELSFQDALAKLYFSFGVNGFLKVQQSMKRKLRKKYERLVWKHLVELYRLPKIALICSLVFVLFLIFRFSSNFSFLNAVFTMAILIGLLGNFLAFYYKKISINLEGKKFLLIDYLHTGTWMMIGSVVLPFDVIWLFSSSGDFFGYKMPVNTISLFVLAAIYVFTLAYAWACGIYLPKRIKEDFTREFPQFVKS